MKKILIFLVLLCGIIVYSENVSADCCFTQDGQCRGINQTICDFNNGIFLGTGDCFINYTANCNPQCCCRNESPRTPLPTNGYAIQGFNIPTNITCEAGYSNFSLNSAQILLFKQNREQDLCTDICRINDCRLNITGTIKNSSGQVLPGVTVKVIAENFVRETTTGAFGQYAVFGLCDKNYTVEASTMCNGAISTNKKQNVRPSINSQTVVDLNLTCTGCSCTPWPCNSTFFGIGQYNCTCNGVSSSTQINCSLNTSVQAVCGDGLKGPGEHCDANGPNPFNYCQSPYSCNYNTCSCERANPPLTSVCGNGLPDSGEECDFGPSGTFSTCSDTTINGCNRESCTCKPVTNCFWNCTTLPETCCDATDACALNFQCTPSPECNSVNPPTPEPEVQDLINANPYCAGPIQTICGNGILDPNEECDVNATGIGNWSACANQTMGSNSCSRTNCQCKPNTYECQWNCINLTTCSNSNFITTVCERDETDENCFRPGSYYPPKPPTFTPCPISTTCGNGQIEEGEECDFNLTSGQGNGGNCRIKLKEGCFNCQCIIPPGSQESCINNPGEVSITTVNAVPANKNLSVNWIVKEDCSSFIKSQTIFRCDNTSGNCIFSKIDIDISKSQRKFIDGNINEKKIYCYYVNVTFNESVNENNNSKKSDIVCKYSGVEYCYKPTTTFCSLNNVSTCNGDNMIQVNEPCGEGFCVYELDGGDLQAKCVNGSECQFCNGRYAFNLFGTIGLRPIFQTEPISCPSIDNRYNSESRCYIDRTSNVSDITKSCKNVNSCYDYTSQNMCEQDSCGKFSLSGCTWNRYNNTIFTGKYLDKGICTPINVSEQKCNLCSVKSKNTIYPTCTADVCGLFGECYFKSEGNRCINVENVSCSDYNNKNDCIGSNNKSIIVNVTWTGNNKTSGNNAIIQNSSDYLTKYNKALNVCKWDDTTNKCFRDADNDNSSKDGGDCKNVDSGLKQICEKDNIPPKTIINNKSHYSRTINLREEISITDNVPEWMLGDCKEKNTFKCINSSGRESILMFYSIINTEEEDFKYPNKILNLTKGQYAIINLSKEIDGQDINERSTYMMFYYSEDPARNLEVIKNFSFKLDLTKPNIVVNFTTKSIKPDFGFVRTNLTVIATLLSNDKSPPVICSIKSGKEMPTGLQVFDLSENSPIQSRTLNSAGQSINTTYPFLFDGRYNITVSCEDTVGNIFIKTDKITIEADGSINNTYPYGEVYRLNNIPKYMNFTTNNSAIECRYAHNESRYSKMIHKFNNQSTDSGKLFYKNISDITPAINETGIYNFFIACNFTDYVIESTPGDIIFFGVDEDAPQTMLINAITNEEYVANFSENSTSNISLKFSSTDNELQFNNNNMSFGVDSTYYCLEGRKNPGSCDDNSENGRLNNYLMINDGTIDLDFNNEPEPYNTTGNYPKICFYSKDKGNNTENINCVGLNIKNTYFQNPDINISIIIMG